MRVPALGPSRRGVAHLSRRFRTLLSSPHSHSFDLPAQRRQAVRHPPSSPITHHPLPIISHQPSAIISHHSSVVPCPQPANSGRPRSQLARRFPLPGPRSERRIPPSTGQLTLSPFNSIRLQFLVHHPPQVRNTPPGPPRQYQRSPSGLKVPRWAPRAVLATGLRPPAIIPSVLATIRSSPSP